MHLPISARACEEVGATLIWREASASTNSELVSQAALADLTVIATDTQTAGRGRLDRAWSTPPGTALAVSVFLAHEPGGAPTPTAPDPRRLGWVPLIAGVAMVRAVRSLGVGAAGLKWPNDVLVDGRKLCGILTELTSTGVVVGAGLNVSMTAHQLPVPTATSLVIEGVPEHGEPIDGEASTLLDRALAAYLRELVPLVGRWREAEHPAELRPLVEQHLQTLGLAVRVDLPGQPPLRGVAVGLDDDGRLLVRPAGTHSSPPRGPTRDPDRNATSGVVAVAAGDVTHLRYE